MIRALAGLVLLATETPPAEAPSAQPAALLAHEAPER